MVLGYTDDDHAEDRESKHQHLSICGKSISKSRQNRHRCVFECGRVLTVQAYIFGGRSWPASLRLILQGVGQPNIDGSIFGYFYAFPLPRRGDRQHREQRPSLLCLSGACQVAASRRLIITSTIKRALQAHRSIIFYTIGGGVGQVSQCSITKRGMQCGTITARH